MKRLILALAINILPVFCFAQQNYREGYIIKANSDTIKGYINIKEWEVSPKSVLFKSTLTDEIATSYTPLDIVKFNTNAGFNYLSYIGKATNNRNVFPDMDTYRDTSTHTDTVFLRELVPGSKVSLYDKFNGHKRSYFYKEAGQPPVELIYYNYYEDATTIKTLPVYIAQIFELQKKYIGTDVTLESNVKLGYKRNDIEKALQKINGDGKAVKQNNGGHSFFVGVGGVVSQSRFEGDNQFVKAGAVSNFSPKISAGADVFSNSVTRRLILRAEASFYYNKPEFSGQDPQYTGASSRVYYEFEQYNITFTPQLLYNYYSTQALRLYLSAGVGLNFSFYKNNRFFTETDAPSYLGRPYKLEQYWANFPLQLGATFNDRYELSFGYTARAAYTSYVSFGINSSILGASLRYHLK